MRSGFRFDPPQVEVSAELRWLLWRAFGTAGEVLTGVADLDKETVTDLARRFDLGARVGVRTPSGILTAELGSETARWFRQQHAGAAARYLLAEQVCCELAKAGRLLEIPLVFLKGAALYLGGKAAPGSRNMGDIDVLAPEEGARRLQRTLVEAGCRAYTGRESEHQLQFLSHRSGLGIEVHKKIPGLRFEGRSSAKACELIERELVQPAPGMEGDCYLPSDEVLLAHVLVHGIAQHGLSPQGYPMARMLADVQDLGADDQMWRNACRWIERDASREEVEAVAGLADRLAAGEDPAEVAVVEDAAGTMLRHLVAGLLDEGYAQSMKFRSLTDKPRDMGRVRATAKTVRGALLPTNAQIDILFGRPKTELGYWGWRLWRPFDLVLRALRYGRAWVEQRLSRR
jgi:hypothetical protein